MKKIIFLLGSVLYSLAYAKSNIIVSIPPQKTFVQKIAKDKAEVTVMVEPGNSPHSYEPKPSQMVSISKADLYFSIGVEFENVWLDRFKAQNPKLKFVNMDNEVPKIQIAERHQHENEHHDEGHRHDGRDPHTWTSPKNVAIMAKNIFAALAETDPANEPFYRSNLECFIKEIQDTDAQIKKALKEIKPKSKFMVFHPSWGYFAHEYDLIQIAVEVEGKTPKPKEMIEVINEAKEQKVKVIFTQPEFSDKSAQIIARETGIVVKKISPLDPNWSENLINIANEIGNK
ncbi:MAG: zinc ABC transporter substrate-binding protein [Sulfurovum sp.]|jgi:zinc transport system substrate-binding protein|nr:zinc ABC transporter substrate-binding protein [Sulfurovum sp.]